MFLGFFWPLELWVTNVDSVWIGFLESELTVTILCRNSKDFQLLHIGTFLTGKPKNPATVIPLNLYLLRAFEAHEDAAVTN